MWLELASDLLLLVGLDAHLLVVFLRAVLGVRGIAERGVVGSDARQLAVAWSEELLWALVRLGKLVVDGIGQLVARVVDEGARDVVLSLALWPRCSHIAPARLGHGADEASSLRVKKIGLISCNERARRLVWHLELPSFLIQVPLLKLVIAEAVCVGVRVA